MEKVQRLNGIPRKWKIKSSPMGNHVMRINTLGYYVGSYISYLSRYIMRPHEVYSSLSKCFELTGVNVTAGVIFAPKSNI
jgi:hypothetical protein